MQTPTEYIHQIIENRSLTLVEADRLHAGISQFVEQLRLYRLFDPMPMVVTDLLTALEEASLQSVQIRADATLNYRSDGGFDPCPLCGSLRTTTYSDRNKRPCCAECGLLCHLYSQYQGSLDEES